MLRLSRKLFNNCKHIKPPLIKGAHSKVINLDENTLTGRLLTHLRKPSPGDNRMTLNLIPNAQSGQWNLKDLHELHNLPDTWRLKEVRKLDIEYCLHMKDMDVITILDVLNCYMLLVPHKIIELHFYKSAVKYLSNHIEFLSLEEKIQFVFYVGLQKKNRYSQKALSRCLRTLTSEQIEVLSMEDLCVICNSTFKTSTRIANVVILDRIIDTINNNLILLKDPAFFITFIKTLRHNRYQNEDILSTISCAVLFNSTYQFYNFGALCHILAVFADYLYYDENVLRLFNEKCVELLRESRILEKRSYLDENIRVKDIKRLLWSCSNLGWKLERGDIQGVIVPKMLERIENGDFNDDPESLVDCVMYLWILNYQAVELVPYCFTESNINMVRERKSNTIQRLNLLVTCMQLENLPLYKKLQVKPDNFHNFDLQLQVSTRPYLQRVYHALNKIQSRTGLDKFTFECQVPHLKIVGITGSKKIYRKVFIEVLDEHFCVKNKQAFAAGLMQLKLRLLDDMDQALIIVPNGEIEEMTDKELEDHLESEIKMVL